MPETRPLDGKNIWPALRDGGASPVESYYWVWRGEDAIRTARWKMHRFSDRFELYDMRKDEGETTNVADTHGDVVKSLEAKMDAWANSLGPALTHRPAPASFDAKPKPEGEVLEIRGEEAVLEAGGIRFTLPLADLESTGRDPRGRAATSGPQLPEIAPATEINLRGLRVEEVEAVLSQGLDAAIVNDVPSLRVIHGKGTGALRLEVARILERDNRVRSHRLGGFQEGGSGVTVVEFGSVID